MSGCTRQWVSKQVVCGLGEVTTLCGTVVAQAQNLWLGVSVHKDLWPRLWLRVSVALVTVACMWPAVRLGQRRSSWVFSFKKECVRFRAGSLWLVA